VADIDTASLKENFGAVAAHGDDVALYFYSYLFLRHPETREMFPPAMDKQRDRLLTALGRIVSNVDRVGELVPFLSDLGRDHRKFGALAAHYPAVGDALLQTLEHFSGDAWNDRLRDDWASAYGIVAGAMSGAADQAAEAEPAYWDAEVVQVEHRSFDIAVLRVRTDEPVPYLAGQSFSLQATELRPREWRFYTPANPPGTADLELHVRLINGGAVSAALALSAKPGAKLRLGSAFGRMVLDPESSRPLLLVAGGTGLAPMKAIIGQLAADGGRSTHLYFGVRTARELYDAEALLALERRHRWLTVVTAVSDDAGWQGPTGLVGEVAAEAADWFDHDVFVCGSPPMVEATVKLLVAKGVPEGQISFEQFGEG